MAATAAANRQVPVSASAPAPVPPATAATGLGLFRLEQRQQLQQQLQRQQRQKQQHRPRVQAPPENRESMGDGDGDGDGDYDGDYDQDNGNDDHENDDNDHDDGYISTGCESIDAALGSGFAFGAVSSVATGDAFVKSAYGLDNTANKPGAEQIDYHAIASHLVARLASEAVVVDAAGTFAVHALKGVVEEKVRQQPIGVSKAPLPHEGYVYQMSSERDADESRNIDADAAVTNAVLDRVKLIRVFDLVGLTDVIREIGQILRGQGDEAVAKQEDAAGADSTNTRIDLVIVDDLSAVFQSLLMQNNVEAQSLLTSFIRSLGHLARNHGVAAIVMRGVTMPRILYNSNREEGVEEAGEDQVSCLPSVMGRPALGKTLSHLVDVDVMVNAIPKERSDAEIAYVASTEAATRSWKTMNFLEVLSDKSGLRNGQVAVFEVDGSRITMP